MVDSKRDFKEFTGNYREVMKSLGLPVDSWCGTSSEELYLLEMDQDLKRTAYLNFNNNVESMKEQLRKTTHLAENEYSYTQGNVTGAVFSGNVVKSNSEKWVALVLRANAEEPSTVSTLTKTIDFHYVDDDEVPCGFAITYLRDDSDQSIPEKERPLSFIVTIIKNVTAAVEQRQVTVLTHNVTEEVRALNNSDISKPNLFWPEAILSDGTNVKASNLTQEIDKAVNCQAVSQLLSGVLSEGTILLEPFLELNQRIQAGGCNIDDRDPKLEKLFELFVIWARLARSNPNDEAKIVMEKLLDEINQAYQDVNYFQHKTIENVNSLVDSYQKDPLVANLLPIEDEPRIKQELMNTVQKYQVEVTRTNAQINKEIESLASQHGYSGSKEFKAKLEASRSRRIIGGLIAIGLVITGVISIVLTLSGVLTPVGIALGVVVVLLAINERKLRAAQNMIQPFDDKMDVAHRDHATAYRENLNRVINPETDEHNKNNNTSVATSKQATFSVETRDSSDNEETDDRNPCENNSAILGK